MSGIYRYSDKINDCVRLFPGQYPNNVQIVIDQPENHNFNFVRICPDNISGICTVKLPILLYRYFRIMDIISRIWYAMAHGTLHRMGG